MDISKWKPTVPNREDMKDKTYNASSKQDYTQLTENQRKLADYIKTSLWDEEMNRRREYWLWERSRIHPKKPEHYYR